MAENDMNQLRTSEEAAVQSDASSASASQNPAFTVQQLQEMAAFEQQQHKGKLSPTQPVSPAVSVALYAGDNPEHPLFSRNERGEIVRHTGASAYQTGEAKPYVDKQGYLDVVGRKEQLAKMAAEDSQKISQYAQVAWPEYAKDWSGRTGLIRNAVADVGTALMSFPRGALGFVANAAGTVLSLPRYKAEYEWQSYYNTLDENVRSRVADFIKAQIEEAERAKQTLEEDGQDEYGDGMYASAQERIFSPAVQSEYGLSGEERNALRRYREVVEARDADMRRSLFIADFSENFGKEGEAALHDMLNLTQDDRNSLAMRLAEAGGELGGNLAGMYVTGRLAGAAFNIGKTAANAFRGKGYLDYARTARAAGAAKLAADAGITAGTAARVAFQEYSIIPTVFSSQFNQLRTEALLSGKDLSEATGIGLIGAAAEAGLEFAGFRIFKRFYTDGGWMRNVLWRNILPEGLQEAAQTAAEDLITETTGVTDKQWTDIMSEVGFSLMAGMIGGGVFSAGRMRFEGTMARFEDVASRYTKALALVGSEKARQAYDMAMDELAFEEWLGRHEEVDESIKEQKRAERSAIKAQQQQVENDVLETKEAIKDMYKELKQYVQERALNVNPDITGPQLQALWDMVKTQVGIALDGNTLTSKYYAAADHVINTYYNKRNKLDKFQTKQVKDMLKASGKYTPKQIAALTSKDHIEKTNAKLDLLETLMSDHLVAQGVGQNEAAGSARVARMLIAPSAIINPEFDAKAMAKQLRTNVLHIKNAAFYRLPGLNDTAFEPISNKMKPFALGQVFADRVQEDHENMTDLSKLLFTEGKISDKDSRRWNQVLYWDETFDPGLSRTREFLRSQAPLARVVIENMPTKLNRNISDEEAGAMLLMNLRGHDWDSVFDVSNIEMRGNRKASNFFDKTARKFVPMPKADDIKKLRRLSNRMEEDPNVSVGEMQRMQQASGLYDPAENLIVLNNEKPGTAFHEHNHFSLFAILNNQFKLDELGLLPDTSLLQPMKDKLMQTMQGARWLTEREFQETLNDALMTYLASGQCKDPVLTSFFAMLKGQGYKARVDLYASRLSKSSESQMSKQQQASLQKELANVFGAGSIPEIITKAHQVREHSMLNDLPQRKENEGIRSHHSRVANMLADELQELLSVVPVRDADEYSRQIELARNEDFGAPITEQVFTPGQTESQTQTIYNKGNITKLLVLGEQISAKALDFAYDVLTSEKSQSESLASDNVPFYDAAAGVISPARQPKVMSLEEVIENLKAITPSWEGVKTVWNNMIESIKDLAFSLEGASGDLSNELRDLIMREVWNESSLRNLFRAQLRPVIDAKDEWFSKFSGQEKKAKQREFNRQVLANLGDGNFTAARNWMSKNWGEKVAKQWDTIMQFLNGSNKQKAEEWMKMSDEERKKNPIGYLYKGSQAILAEAGVAVDPKEYFFPMLVRDFKGLTKNRFGHAYTYSEIDKLKARLLEQYMSKTTNKDESGNISLSREEREAYEKEVAELVNSRMQRNVTDEEKVSSFYHRRLTEYGKALDKEAKAGQEVSILDYYFDPFESLDRYFDAVFRTATMRHLIGHTVQMDGGKEKFTNLSSLKEAVKKIEENKNLTKDERERNVNELLAANGKVGLYLATHDFSDAKALKRFMNAIHAYAARTSSDPEDFFNWIRAVNQVTMLGSIFSALNQINDLQYCFTMFGIKPTAQALSDVIFNRNGADFVKLEDIGGEVASEAFRPSDETPLGKLTSWVLHYSGFEWADVRLKEVTVNAFRNYAQKMAQDILSGKKERLADNKDVRSNRFWEVLDEVAPDGTVALTSLSKSQIREKNAQQALNRAQLLEDLAAGRQTADVKYFEWYMLCKMQPMNSATVSAHYNQTGSFGKLCWQFNTVASRQFGFLRETALREYKERGPLAAAKWLAKFAMMAYIVGIPKEVLEAFLKGQKPDAYDLVAVPTQAAWVNRYTLSTAKRQGLFSAATQQFSPKSGFLSNATRDFFGIVTLDFKGYTMRSVPLIGPFVWNILGAGRTAAIKQDKALFHHKMTKDEYEAKKAKAQENADYMKTGE